MEFKDRSEITTMVQDMQRKDFKSVVEYVYRLQDKILALEKRIRELTE